MRDINQAAQENELVAFFKDRSDALSAISELKEAGFTSDQIGFAVAGSGMSSAGMSSAGMSSTGMGSTGSESIMDQSSVASQTHASDDRGMWDKIKDFFSGEHENYSGANQDYENTFSHLSVSPDQSRYYSQGISAGGALVTVRTSSDRVAIARGIITDNDGDLRTSGFSSVSDTGMRSDTSMGSDTSLASDTSRGLDRGITGSAMSGNTSSVGSEAEQRLELRGELLRAVKQRVQTGEIRLRKDVITENQTINVPVTREDVIVERVSADQIGNRPASAGTIGEGEEIRIPVSEERVTVTKEPVVTGEVRVQKRAVQDTQQVSDTVRHEEVRVENEGNVQVTDKITDKKTGKKKPAA